jgi:uncharacterized protein (TIGR03790 family)
MVVAPMAVLLAALVAPLAAQEPAATAPSASNADRQVPPSQRWAVVPRVNGHLRAKDLGLVINTDDPYSVEVGQYYAKARKIPEDQILRVKLPVNKPALTREEFAELSRKIDQFYGNRVQGLALAWKKPFAADCNSITGALTMGFDPELCKQTCAQSRTSKYFASASSRPYDDFKMRLSMLLAAPDLDDAKDLIKRGVASDGTQGISGQPPSNIYLLNTSDQVRSVRRVLFPPDGLVPTLNFDVHIEQKDVLGKVSRVLIYETGLAQVAGLEAVQFVPGALADHLTSFGGWLEPGHGQMTVLSWIAAGATASYGTTSEPCAHMQKFPHPQALILFYAQGVTALEAYWKSVAWPQQGLFVGEPLAAPFDLSGR